VVRRQRREAHHSPPLSAEVKKKTWIYAVTFPYVFTPQCLVKHRDKCEAGTYPEFWRYKKGCDIQKKTKDEEKINYL
jgi:hypothetical protein